MPMDLRERLLLVDPVRAFAREIGLRVDGQYTRYVDWPGDRLVTTLVRTRPGSLEPVPWRFPFLGPLPYKGYFDRERAEREARRLEQDEGYDVCVSAVPAYSTLGWLDDPVTRPMLLGGPARLVEMLLHELVHATAFLPGEAAFNESAAQFIGQQGAIAFFEHLERLERGAGPQAPPIAAQALPPLPSADRVRAAIADRRRIAETLLEFRDHVAALTDHPERPRLRAEAERAVRAQLAALPLVVLDAEQVASGARLGDACLALRGTYARDLPRHARVFRALESRLPAMIERLRRWGDEERPTEAFFVVGEEAGGVVGEEEASGASEVKRLSDR